MLRVVRGRKFKRLLRFCIKYRELEALSQLQFQGWGASDDMRNSCTHKRHSCRTLASPSRRTPHLHRSNSKPHISRAVPKWLLLTKPHFANYRRLADTNKRNQFLAHKALCWARVDDTQRKVDSRRCSGTGTTADEQPHQMNYLLFRCGGVDLVTAVLSQNYMLFLLRVKKDRQ